MREKTVKASLRWNDEKIVLAKRTGSYNVEDDFTITIDEMVLSAGRSV